jgi:hypothetical protein
VQSERIKASSAANRFQAISQASMMSARLAYTELASQWLRTAGAAERSLSVQLRDLPGTHGNGRDASFPVVRIYEEDFVGFSYVFHLGPANRRRHWMR